MAATPELKVFYCYAHEDQQYHKQLEAHMANLKRRYNLTTWFDHKILPGERREEVIESNLNSADLIFLLVSSAFMDSDDCNKEMTRALKRHEQGEAKVIPIIVSPVHWDGAPFSSIQALPDDTRPIASWPNPDDAFYNVVLGVESVIKSLLAPRQAQEWLDKGEMFRKLKQDNDALAAYDQAIRLNPNSSAAYYGEGYVLNNLKRYNEAVQAFDLAIRLDPTFARSHNNKGNALYALKRYNEAVQAFDQAIHLDPTFAKAYYNKGVALNEAKRYNEAVQAFDQTIRLAPNVAKVYNNKGITLNNLKNHNEAIQAFDLAIYLDPTFARAYYNKGNALYALKRYDEAVQAFDHAIRLDPNFTNAHHHKGVALEKMGGNKQA